MPSFWPGSSDRSVSPPATGLPNPDGDDSAGTVFGAEPAGTDEPASYIVTLRTDGPLRTDRAALRRDSSRALRAQDDLLTRARAAGIEFRVAQRYSHALNGFAADLAPDQAARVAALPGVLAVTASVTYEIPTAPTPVSSRQVSEAAKGAIAAAGREETSAAPPQGREVITATNLTKVPAVKRRGFDGRGVTIGVIDSGIDYRHPALGGGEFPNSKVVGGYDFADEDPGPYDDNILGASGHGTHVAGIAAGSDSTMEGVAPGAKLRAYRVFGTKNEPTDEVVLAALDRAVADRVDVINMSLGSNRERSNSPLSLAVNRTVQGGIPVAVAIGNGYAGPFNAGAPSIAANALSVGSTLNDRRPVMAVSLNDETGEIPFLIAGSGGVPPSSGTQPVVVAATNCDPLEPGSLDGKSVLFTQGEIDWEDPCRAMAMVRNFEQAGASSALFYDPGYTDQYAWQPCCGRAPSRCCGSGALTPTGSPPATTRRSPGAGMRAFRNAPSTRDRWTRAVPGGRVPNSSSSPTSMLPGATSSPRCPATKAGTGSTPAPRWRARTWPECLHC